MKTIYINSNVSIKTNCEVYMQNKRVCFYPFDHKQAKDLRDELIAKDVKFVSDNAFRLSFILDTQKAIIKNAAYVMFKNPKYNYVTSINGDDKSVKEYFHKGLRLNRGMVSDDVQIVSMCYTFDELRRSYTNDFLTVERFAEYYQMNESTASYILNDE